MASVEEVEKEGLDISLADGAVSVGHMEDLDAAERSQAFHSSPLTRKEQMSSFFTIFAAGAALISDGYQNNILAMLNVVFAKLYSATFTNQVSTRVNNALLVGAIFGQLSVGLICDISGRKTAIVLATLLIVTGAALCTAAHGAHGSAEGLFWFLTFARGIVGVGVGAEYPASSTSAAEAANERVQKHRGSIFILVTNLPLSFGGILAVIVFLIVLSATGPNHLETLWRVCFGIGIIFPLTVFYFRIRMLNSALYRKGAIKRKVPYLLVAQYYWRSLIGTAGAWFIYDFVTFPNGLFSGQILASVTNGTLKSTAEWQLLLGSIALPGVAIGALLVNKLGRKNSMIIGFSGYLIFGLIIGLSYDKITKITPLFVIFYGLMQSLGNFGPGDMLGLTSSESYATPVRGTLYGLSAAVGKVGAAVGTSVFKSIQAAFGKKWTFIIAAIAGVSGVLVTFFFIRDLTGVDLADEDAKFQTYLFEHGWRGEVGTDGLQHKVAYDGARPAAAQESGKDSEGL